MDTMTFTKAAAGVLGAFLIFLLGQWAAEVLYTVESEGEPAYAIETGEEEEPAEEVVQISFADMLAEADLGKGASVFKKCAACHKLNDGENAAGPYLYGVVGRPIGAAEGFGYSNALAELGGEWTPEALNEFLTKPSAFAPGTSMSFSGLRRIDDRANVIAYLDSLDD